MTSIRIPSLTAGAALVALACGSGDQAGAAADTTARDLTLALAETTAALGDAPAAQPAQTRAPAQREPQRRSRPPAERPVAERPAAPATLSLPAGTRFELAAADTITSRTARVGDTVTTTVVEAVKDAQGRVVIPAGSVARGRITDVKPAPNPSETGTLTLAFTSIAVRGTDYPLEISVDSIETVHKGRGIEGADAARVGAGAAAGAVAGRIIGKDTKGAVIGGIVGAAVGAGVSAGVKDVDIVLPKGAHIVVRLARGLTVAAS